MSKNRDLLEQAALDTVQRSGLKGLSFRNLADEIGIKSSSVHYYCPEKSDLAKTLIERYSEAFFVQLIDIKPWCCIKFRVQKLIELYIRRCTEFLLD